jgi:hypothetical protein
MKRGAAVYAALRAGQRRTGGGRYQHIDDIFARLFRRLGTHDTYALLGTSNVFGDVYDADGRFERDILDDNEWIRSLTLCKHTLWHMPELVAKFKAMFQTGGESYAQLMRRSLDFVDRLRADRLPHQLRANIPLDRIESVTDGLCRMTRHTSQYNHLAQQQQFTACDVFMFTLDLLARATPAKLAAWEVDDFDDLSCTTIMTEFYVAHPAYVPPYFYRYVVEQRHVAAAAAENAANAEMKDVDEAVTVPSNHWDSVNRPVPDNRKPNVHKDRTMDEG